MMNFDEIIAKINEMDNGGTVSISTVLDYTKIEFLDFDGFDEDWNELDNPEYDDDLADDIYDMIDENTIVVERNILRFHQTTDGKLIYICCASDDI